jgi:16S rRNA (guanine527-N7)-methyltransferase
MSQRDDFVESLVLACASIDVPIEDADIERMWQHFVAIREVNERMNITRITDPRRAAVEHYADSLTLLGWLDALSPQPRHALDVGTGGGWPGVPLAIMRPAITWTAIDATAKKIAALQRIVADLGVTNLSLAHARPEWLRERRGDYDLIVARAVGKIAPLLAPMAPLLRRGGHVVFYKTAHITADECAAGDDAARRVKLSRRPDHRVVLRGDRDAFDRCLIVYRRDK